MTEPRQELASRLRGSGLCNHDSSGDLLLLPGQEAVAGIFLSQKYEVRWPLPMNLGLNWKATPLRLRHSRIELDSCGVALQSAPASQFLY